MAFRQLFSTSRAALRSVIRGSYLSTSTQNARSKAAKIGAQTAWLSVALVQLTATGQFIAEEYPQLGRGRQHSKYVVQSFRVQIAAKALELRSQQHRVGVVDLLRRIPPTWAFSPYRGMGLLNRVQRPGSHRPPAPVRSRGHSLLPPDRKSVV